jgi:hypothetical protein
MNVIIRMILFLPFIQIITTMSMSSSSQISTKMLSPSHMITSMLPSRKKDDNTKFSGQCYGPAK